MTPFGGAGGLAGRTVWILSNLDWSAPWQPVHEIATRLARANDVVFIETTGRRHLRPKDLPRLARRFTRRPDGTAAPASLRVVSPRALPFPSSRRAARVNASLLLRAIGAPESAPVLWAYLPSPTVLELRNRLRDPPLVYHCMLDFQALPGAPAGVGEVERRIVASSALTVVDSGTLLAERGWRCARIAHLPSGADTRPFRDARRARVVPGELSALPRPLAGFVGSVDYRLDTRLLRKAAELAPHWTFAIVGPADRRTARALARPTNIHLLGSRRHEELPAVVAGFDVGLIPYADTAVRRTTFPAKFFEYLAAGVPVVSTALPDLEPYAKHVRTAAAPADFVAALEEAAADAAVAERMAVAAVNDWSERELQWLQLLRQAGLVD